MPPPGIVTPALLSSIRGQPHLPRGCWYFVAGVTLNALNLSAEIPTVFNHAMENGAGASPVKPDHSEKLNIARKLRESLIKAAAICGLPKVLWQRLCSCAMQLTLLCSPSILSPSFGGTPLLISSMNRCNIHPHPGLPSFMMCHLRRYSTVVKSIST